MLIWFHTLTISVPNIKSAKNSKVVLKTSCSYILRLRCQCRWELEIQKSKWKIFDSYYVESCNFIRVACKGYTRDRQFSCGVSIGGCQVGYYGTIGAVGFVFMVVLQERLLWRRSQSQPKAARLEAVTTVCWPVQTVMKLSVTLSLLTIK